MEHQSLQDKIAFFHGLDALDNDNLSDADDDVNVEEQNHRDKCRAFFSSRKGSSRSHPRRTTSMPTPSAVVSRPQVIEATPDMRNSAVSRTTRAEQLLAGSTSFVEETPFPAPSLRRSTTLPLPTPPSTADQSPSARKRKRQASTKQVAEAAQIFRGLSFYYIPNNDVAPARKLRIAKAKEYGAQWVRDLSRASHVIVDRDLSYKDIQKILGPAGAESPVVVNEEYPIDCISFRTLLNPDQNRYRVSGWPTPPGVPCSDQGPPVPSQNSDRSLQLKPGRTSRRRDSRGTPPRAEQPPPQSDIKDAQANLAPLAAGISANSAAASVQPNRPRSADSGGKPGEVDQHLHRTSGVRDELSEYIEIMQQYKHLPLDIEEDDLQSAKDVQETVSESEREGSEDERARKRSTAKTRRAPQKDIPFEERFACNRGGTKDKSANAQNPNARTIEVLQSMCDYYSRINDQWRTLAYRKAIATLRRQPTRIMTEEEAYRLPNIGRRLAAKIEEIVTTNKLRRLEYANDEPLDLVLENFLKIYDVGISRANKWIAQGFRTLDDLRQKADLTTNQRIGIDHYDDLNTRIPRAEIAALFGHVKREAAQLDPAVELLVGGSYRRGSDSSGDIDIIVTKKGTESSAELVPFLEELVDVLTRKGFLVATLAALNSHGPGKDGPGSKWHGCCVLPQEGHSGGGGAGEEPRQVWRRIDFLLVPESEYGAALIYFTGNDIFNRSMRLLASKKGMRLNQRGLYKEVMRGRGGVKVTDGELLEGRDERRIFELLGVKWREPRERWC